MALRGQSMRKIIIAISGLMFGCLLTAQARSEVIAITYTGVVTDYSISGFTTHDYSNLLGAFTLNTTIDTSVGTLVPSGTGFQFSAGFAPLVYPIVPSAVPDYATMSRPGATWGYYGARIFKLLLAQMAARGISTT
jgi:hypothetical protein